jgi:hypothetical protein
MRISFRSVYYGPFDQTHPVKKSSQGMEINQFTISAFSNLKRTQKAEACT